jgi:hypothetical protein
MKQYPSIPYWNDKMLGRNCIAFDKLDGNNIRLEWSKSKKWYKFGTKTQLIDSTTPIYGNAIHKFMGKYSEGLERIFKDKYPKIPNFVVFCEYWGEKSFSGKHVEGDDMNITLIDVNGYKKGQLPVLEFLNNFGVLDIPKVIYYDRLNNNFINDIKLNRYNLSEGVICREISDKWVCKVKTDEWLKKVKSLYGQNFLLSEVNNNPKLIVDI